MCFSEKFDHGNTEVLRFLYVNLFSFYIFVFQTVDNVEYTFVKKCGIYFVFTSLSPGVSLCWTIELLNKLVKSIKDFCGVLSEESLRRNFILMYELIDEIIDSGYPQTTASEILKLSVHSEAIDPTSASTFRGFSSIRGLASTPPVSTVPSWANQRPIGVSSSASSSPLSSLIATLPLGNKEVVTKNEIFVDIMERLNVVMDGGSIVSASIDGSIQMKSYLSGNPSLRVSLNEDLIIATDDNTGQYSSSLLLDDANFHECANMTEFESNRILTLNPPDGEFVLMNYRISKNVKIPFSIFPTISRFSDRIEVTMLSRADLPCENYGSALVLSFPVQGAKSADVQEGTFQDDSVIWNIKKLQGGNEHVARSKIFFNEQKSVVFGPISLSFEVPMYSSSNMQVRYLRIQDGSASPVNTPFRWVRYVTQSSSYRVNIL